MSEEDISLWIGRILKEHYENKKKVRPNLSVRWLAQKLSVSPGFMSMILNGKRLPSMQYLTKLCRLLEIDFEAEDKMRRILLKKKNLVLHKNDLTLSSASASSGPTTTKKWILAEKAQFVALKDWFYFPIMQTMLLKDYDGTAEFIADFLKMELETVLRAIDELVEARLVDIGDDQGFRKANAQVEFKNRDRSLLTKHHLANIRKVAEKIENEENKDSMENRLVTSSCFSCRKEDIPLLKQKMTEFIREMATTNDEEGHDEVCFLLMQLVPFDS